MAAPIATQQPTINRAWEAFVPHIPTMLLIWLVTAVLSGVGLVVSLLATAVGLGLSGGDASTTVASVANLLGQLGQLPFAILSGFVGVLFTAVPVLYYQDGEVITAQAAFAALLKRPWRYFWAGVLFTVAVGIGLLLCVVPGIVVALIAPIYVNRIFLTDLAISEAFAGSFQTLYRSERGRGFVGVEILAWLLMVVFSLCTCGLGALLAVPVSAFYMQNAAYHRGLIR